MLKAYAQHIMLKAYALYNIEVKKQHWYKDKLSRSYHSYSHIINTTRPSCGGFFFVAYTCTEICWLFRLI
jgi:hypothetical protein